LASVLREIEAAANATSASWLSSVNAPDLMRQARRIAQDVELTSKPVLSPESYIYHKTRRIFEKHDAMDLFNLYAHGDKTIEVARYVPRAIHSRTRLPGSKQYHVYRENFRLGQLMFGDHNRRLKAVRKSATERMEIVWPESFSGELSLSLSVLIDDLLFEYKKSLARYFYSKKGAAAFMRRLPARSSCGIQILDDKGSRFRFAE